MTNPEDYETRLKSKTAVLEAAVEGKTPYSVFNYDDGQQAWTAHKDPEHFALYQWSNEDGSYIDHAAMPISESERQAMGANLNDFIKDQPAESTGLKYIGIATREPIIDYLLDWLRQYGDDEKVTKITPGTSGFDGILDAGNGPVLLTDEGALVFGAHIRAMQARGATYYTF